MSQSTSPEATTDPRSSILFPSDATTLEDHLKIFRHSLKFHVPYTGGVHAVKPEDLVIYYDVEGERPWYAKASAEDLKHLATACQQATFGVAQQDILDETYRKAGKMDLDKFAARLDVVASGLLDAITPDMLQGQSQDTEKVIRAEMYKLDVYGEFSRKDTPRGDTMIGSLVVVFPTAHEGGELTLEHGATTWTFDSPAELTKIAPTPALAYVAFYSDVTHAVEPVRTGYRVTLTYNLFLADRVGSSLLIVPGPAHRVIPAPEQAFEDALCSLLASLTFLPAGSLLAYGLAHQYPMPAPPEAT
ncbi:hypothetical protein C8R43DRAFT_1241993 [Mycena crocata]|nr:hypothetical protein C8R43DRAFT_1241993 [Mycena crocata]